MTKTIQALVAGLAVLAVVIPGAAQEQAQEQDPVGITPTLEDVSNESMKRPCSPYAGRGFPTQVYWGDTHVHTNNSLDARGFGVILGPEEAYRFARGEEWTLNEHYTAGGYARWRAPAGTIAT